MSEVRKGRKLTEEHRQNISSGHKGKTMDPEHVAKWHAGLTPEIRAASRLKFSETMRTKWQDPEWRAAQLVRMSQESTGRSLKEGVLKSILESRGISLKEQVPIDRVVVDFLDESTNTVYEMFGCYYHGCKACGFNNDWQQKQRYKDGFRKRLLRSLGYNVVIVWEHELKEMTCTS